MLHFLDPFRNLEFWGVFLRMLVACLCGMVIGLERSAKNRPAGFRTHILVCLGGTMASMVNLYLYLVLLLPADVSRIGAAVVSGLGFIGAGTIIITKKKSIKGLTTAAGLWTCGIIGLAIGSGFFELGIFGTFMVLFIEIVLAPIGARIQQNPVYTLELSYEDKDSLDSVMRLCKDRHMSIVNLQIVSSETEKEGYDAILTIRGKTRLSVILPQITQMRGILSVESH